jgi:uncharacterized protein YndB with AHSA1/START domain
MQKELVVKKTTQLNAAASKVWEALTNPELTKQYMYGCQAISDWKIGSPINWKGFAEGKEGIFVKGNITNIEPGKILQYTTFDPNAGYEDIPANYLTVTQELSEENGRTVLSTTQGDFAKVVDGEKRYNASLQGWDYALNGLKELVERQA